MRSARLKWWMVLLCVGALGGFPMAVIGAQELPEVRQVAPLGDDQCVLCHKAQPVTIAARGGKHKTEVGCQDCHTEHPPSGQGAIPACSMCHSGKAHYELDNCSGCHADTHAPATLSMQGDQTGACLTCHEAEGRQMAQNPSVHAEMACTDCHAEHKAVPNCMDCHDKHTEDMDLAACLSCHPAHEPLVVTYPRETPSRYCASCHGEADKLLSANHTKHRDLSCAFCHRDRHKAVPPCYACHGKPHPDKMLKKFKACGDCHSTAHDLRGS